MPNLLAMSFEGDVAPSFDLRCLRPGARHPDGWGIGYYPGGEPSASVLKEPAPPQGSIRSELIKAWEHLASPVFVLHIRTAKWGANNDANTQPFARSWGGRDWLLGHSGSLRYRPETAKNAPFEPVGTTDTELIFCELLNRLASRGWKSLGDAPPDVLREWFVELNGHGALTTLLTDGRDVCVYADKEGVGDVYTCAILPPHGRVVFGDDDLQVDLTRRGIKTRKGMLISSCPLTSEGDPMAQWTQLLPGHLLLIREGAVRAHVKPRGVSEPPSPSRPVASRSMPVALPRKAEVKRLRIKHRTAYHYDKAVERSTHLLRLTPFHDRLQRVISHKIDVSVPGINREYDDVFGNQARRITLDTPFNDLVIEATSEVEMLDVDPMRQRPPHEHSSIPLVWMPRQRHMLEPYLLPPELPDTQLEELAEYAMHFVERNDDDILDALLDLNSSIFKEYRYAQGTTTVGTTAFDVYAERRGVCQDFTNLFICLARLLGVPARYVCGYLWTGPKHPNHKMAEATHAWAQVYLPEVGWRGFDPTNGVLTQTDHVRASVGRNYLDATPTSGTLYVGGGRETLQVEVIVERVDGGRDDDEIDEGLSAVLRPGAPPSLGHWALEDRAEGQHGESAASDTSARSKEPG